jgi:alcohol dehydrogenase
MFYCPVKIFETLSLEDTNIDLKDFGEKCLIVTGKNSSKENGSLDELTNFLQSQKIKYSIFDKVDPNPTFSNIVEGITLSENTFFPDFVIGLGGGSPMDAAKAIGILLKNPKYRVMDLYNPNLEKDSLPLIMIPTTAGTGSEVTQYSVLTNENTKQKRGFASQSIFPKIAILNPKYQYHTPIRIVIDTGMDVLSHAVEAILSTKANWYSDMVSIKAIKMVKDNLQNSINGDKKARENMMRASTLAGIAISQTGTIMIHAMGYPLTTYKGIAHGRANAILMPVVLDYLSKYTEKVYDIYSIFGDADAFSSFVKSFVPDNVNLTQEEIDRFSSMTVNAGNMKVTPTEVSLYDLSLLYSKI